MRRLLFLCLTVFALAEFPAVAQIFRKDNAVRSAPDRRPMSTGYSVSRPNADGESKVDFRSQTILVQVPVVVLDGTGNHVAGLDRDAFEIQENGKTQKITNFEELAATGQPLIPVNTAPGTFSNMLGDSTKPHNTTIVVFDTVNTPFLDQAFGRKELIRYLASGLDSGRSLALVVLSSRGIRILQNPTQDSAPLLQAVNRLNGELSVMEGTDVTASTGDSPSTPFASPVPDPYAGLRNFVLQGDSGISRLQQDRAIEATMRGFLDISWALSGVTGRKSLIWATGGFPFYLDSPGSLPGGPLSLLYERTLKALSDAQISVYPVDVRGLVNTNPGANNRGVRGPAAAQQMAARNWLQSSTIDTLGDFAEMTGGKAFYNTNDIAASFRRAANDSASYYVLSYYLDTSNRNPGWRKLKVKVSRKDVEVRSRNGFFVTNATVNPALSLKLDLDFAVNSPFDCTGVPLSVQWTDLAPAGPAGADGKSGAGSGKKVGFLLRVAGNGVSIEPGTANHFNLDLIAYAFGRNQTEAPASFAKNFEGSFPDTQLPKFREKGFGFNHALELPPGQYTVRFVVRDNLSGRVGSVSAPVTVN
jgi:VWFA-related protein